jgi:hypothetical protein
MDTSEVEIGGELLSLAEALARNTHEIWAQMRVREGWSYGPTRDDLRKSHPCLVRYEEMSEADREFDRAMMIETLKAAIALGFRNRSD